MLDLVDRLAELLKSKTMTLVTAESCTGGLLAATLTHKSGASAFFDRGFVTYSNAAKMEILLVKDTTLKLHGAVSAQTAEEMALGALKRSDAGLAVSITGIAGPEGGTRKKPVGLVFFGYALKGGSVGNVQYTFEGSRHEIQSAATMMALKHLITVLERAE